MTSLEGQLWLIQERSLKSNIAQGFAAVLALFLGSQEMLTKLIDGNRGLLQEAFTIKYEAVPRLLQVLVLLEMGWTGQELQIPRVDSDVHPDEVDLSEEVQQLFKAAHSLYTIFFNAQACFFVEEGKRAILPERFTDTALGFLADLLENIERIMIHLMGEKMEEI